MKKYTAILCAIGMFSGVAQANILVNGGFEDTAPVTVVIQNPPIADGSIAEWRVFNTDTTPMTVEVISNPAVASEGTNYLQVTSTFSGVPGQDGGVDTVRDISSPQTLAMGSTYMLSFDLQHVSGSNSVVVNLESFLEGTDTIIESYLVGAVSPNTGAWTHYTYEINPASNGVFYAGFRPKVGAEVQTEVFLLDNLSLELVPFDPDTVTNATITATGLIGEAGDELQNATVTSDSGVHPVANIVDLFSTGSAVTAEDVIFKDGDGVTQSFVEFNLASAISLTNINITLQNDDVVDAPDNRSLNRIKVYAGLTPSPRKLVADIAVDPEYKDTYGSNRIVVDIDLAVDAQYFWVGFTEPGSPYPDSGARVFEVDGYGAPYIWPVNPASIISWSAISSDVMKMVINIPGLPTDYSPQATTDLISVPWGSVAHSDDGVHAFVVTNMDYSTISGTNKVIYMQSTDAQKFFNVGGN